MTTLYLIRHAMTDAVGRFLAGRAPGLHLNPEGRAQAAGLAERLAAVPLSHVYTSPLERARETAAPLAARHDLPVETREPLGEIDYGDWTGRPFTALAEDPIWRRYNRLRSLTRIPGGELAAGVQARVAAELAHLAAAHPNGSLALVSHADVVRAALAHCAAIPLDLLLRVEIAPASVSIVVLGEHAPSIRCVNHSGHLPA